MSIGKMINISIAMCTYNGAKYIAEQIESIAKQSMLPSEIVICDDGSSDGTIDLIEKLSIDLPFRVIIHKNQENLHFTGNFLKAASLCSGAIIAFCDQDDIWENRKIERCLDVLLIEEVDLVIHEGRVVDSNGNPTKEKIPDLAGSMEDIAKAPFDRVSKGFAMVMRREIIDGLMACWNWKEYIDFKRKFGVPLGHDLLIYAWCVGVKKIGYVREELVKYRVHAENVTAREVITRSRASRFVSFFSGLTLDEKNYRVPGRKWAAEVEFLKSYMIRCSPARHPGLEQLSEWLDLKSSLWLSRAIIYNKQINRFMRGRMFARLVFSGGYLSFQEPRLGFGALAKDSVVASIY